MKLVKIEKIKENISEIAKNYDAAMENNDIELLKQLEIEYQNQRKLLYSCENYLEQLNKNELKESIENAKTKNELKDCKSLLIEKNNYKKDKKYINMIEKSNTIGEYIVNNKKRKIVKRNFKKVVLGISLLAIVSSGVACLSNKKGVKKQPITTTENEIKYNYDEEENDNITEEITTIVLDDSNEQTEEIITENSNIIYDNNSSKPTTNVDIKSNNPVLDSTPSTTVKQEIIPETTERPTTTETTTKTTEEPTTEKQPEKVTIIEREEPTPVDNPTIIEEENENNITTENDNNQNTPSMDWEIEDDEDDVIYYDEDGNVINSYSSMTNNKVYKYVRNI